MNTASIVPATPAAAPLALLDGAEAARDYAKASRAPGTARVLRLGWAAFSAWSDRNGVPALPASPAAVASFLADEASRVKVGTLRLRRFAIGARHRAAGLEDPCRSEAVRAVLSGIVRTHGSTPVRKTAVTTSVLRGMLSTLPENLLGVRDRALLLLGFAAALRRSELVALDVEDVAFRVEGLVVMIRRSKTDQAGEGVTIGVPYGSHPETCPVRTLKAWLDATGISTGPLFRSVNRHGQVAGSRLTDRAVALIVKRTVGAAGLDASTFSGHSLRAGFATSAAEADVPEHRIARQTRHKSVAMLRVYVRPASLFKRNAAASVGL